jgi:hypothetical protein
VSGTGLASAEEWSQHRPPCGGTWARRHGRIMIAIRVARRGAAGEPAAVGCADAARAAPSASKPLEPVKYAYLICKNTLGQFSGLWVLVLGFRFFLFL